MNVVEAQEYYKLVEFIREHQKLDAFATIQLECKVCAREKREKEIREKERKKERERVCVRVFMS